MNSPPHLDQPLPLALDLLHDAAQAQAGGAGRGGRPLVAHVRAQTSLPRVRALDKAPNEQKDLIDDRYPSEQNPSSHWLAPVHYFWPG